MLRADAARQQLPKRVIPQRFAIRSQRLPEDLRSMCYEEQPWTVAKCCACGPIVERRDDCLSRARSSNQEIPRSTVCAFAGKLLKHVGLVGLGLKVKEGDVIRCVLTSLSSQSFRNGSSAFGIIMDVRPLLSNYKS